MISVVMGVYNGEKTVERAVRSVLEGSYSDIEFIAVDDGSTDGTAEILSKIAEEDSRLKIIFSKKNFGLAHALNAGLKVCRGEFVARMDADDIAHPDRLSKELRYLLDTNADFVSCGVNLFDENGTWGERFYPETVAKDTLCRYNPFVHPGLLIKKSALDAVGGYCESAEKLRCEDYDLFVRLYKDGFIGRNIPEKLLDYYEPKDVSFRYNFKIRINEYRLRKEAVKVLGGSLKSKILVFKPLLLGVMPKKIYQKYRMKKWSYKEGETKK